MSQPTSGPGELFTPTTTPTPVEKQVGLYLADSRVCFIYGPDPDDIIDGDQVKIVTRSEADRIIQLGKNNSIEVLERDAD